jgi:hypothetical protein
MDGSDYSNQFTLIALQISAVLPLFFQDRLEVMALKPEFAL